MVDLTSMTIAELLAIHVHARDELRNRNVVRTDNTPTGDLAEHLFCKAFEWRQEENSKKGFDATGPDGTRYQIKGRRIHRRNRSRQLSSIRNIADKHFDTLAGVLFDDDYRVLGAALIPHAIVVEQSTYHSHTNSHIFMLSKQVWEISGVRDVTADVAAAMS